MLDTQYLQLVLVLVHLVAAAAGLVTQLLGLGHSLKYPYNCHHRNILKLNVTLAIFFIWSVLGNFGENIDKRKMQLPLFPKQHNQNWTIQVHL